MAKKKEVPAAVVLSPFRDKNNFDLAYRAGQDVSDLPEDRLSELVAAGLVKVNGKGEVSKPPTETDPQDDPQGDSQEEPNAED